MRSIIFWVFVLGIAIGRGAEARSYVPMGSPLGIPTSTQDTFLPAKVQNRPFLPGLRPVELELLEDALRRKMPRTIGDSREKAHQKIIRNALRDPVKRSHIKGILAEALYLEKNPNWGYVAKANAPQVDVYVRIAGQRRPIGAQIKTHVSANPSVYAQDMRDDHEASRFLVPDDHVESLREHWRSQLRGHEAAGRTVEAIEARKQLARIRALGFTSKDLDNSYSRAARFALREQYAGYVSLGAGVALALGPQLWDAWQSGSVTDQMTLRPAHAASILAVERGTAYVLSRHAKTILSSENANTTAVSRLGSGALRGGLRGNAITGMAMLVTDTAWTVYENGGARAFQSENFYTNWGGGVSGLSLGLLVGCYVTSSTGNPMIGGAAGFVAGAAAGTAGYLGGRAATRRILEVVNPEFLHKEEDLAIADTKKYISEEITQLKVDRRM